MVSGARQVSRIRAEYLKALLRQDVAWYDVQATSNLTIRLTNNITNIRLPVSEQPASFLSLMGRFFAGFMIAFAYGWKLALVILGTLPITTLVDQRGRKTFCW